MQSLQRYLQKRGVLIPSGIFLSSALAADEPRSKGADLIQFERDTCGNLGAALRREWLETNGLGGFGSSTIIGLNTRRYHGLLVAATKPPLGRVVLLSKLEETLFMHGQSFGLSANRCPGVVHPTGLSLSQAVFPRPISGVHL
jgi:hypothetical protein